MPKAKPVSLYPLSFEEAIKAISRVEPRRILVSEKLKNKSRRHSKRSKK